MLRLACARAARRGFATAAPVPKLDWSEVAARVNSDDAKREVASLKKLVEDYKETLAAQAKARRRGAGPRERASAACCTEAMGHAPLRGSLRTPRAAAAAPRCTRQREMHRAPARSLGTCRGAARRGRTAKTALGSVRPA